MRQTLTMYFYVRVDRTRKVPIDRTIHALGVGSNAEIIDLFGGRAKDPCKFYKGYIHKL